MATTGSGKESATTRQRTQQAKGQGQGQQGQQGQTQKEATQHPESRQETARTATVNLPFVTAQFRMPETRFPWIGRREVSDLAGVVGSALPSREKTLYYAGLGTLAAFEIIEWPVAVAIGAGTAVAQRAMREGSQRDTREASPEARQSASA